MRPREGKLPPMPRSGEPFTAYLIRVLGLRRPPKPKPLKRPLKGRAT